MVPEDGANAGWVWIEHRVVVVVFDNDVGVLLGGRDQDFGVVEFSATNTECMLAVVFKSLRSAPRP